MIRSQLFFFISSLFISVAAMFISYFLAIDNLIPYNKNLGLMTYKEMLLEKIPSPRIIIDSGSNSIWSVYPEEIEKKFNYPSFVVSDWAGIPLNMRVARIHHYAKNGDIIILPIEWYSFKETYSAELVKRTLGVEEYTKDDIRMNSLQNSLFNYYQYYASLDILDRIRFVSTQINPIQFARKLLFTINSPKESVIYNTNLLMLLSDYHRMKRGDKKDDLLRLRKQETLSTTCNAYIFGGGEIDYKLVNTYAEKLAKIQSEKGAKILITPPAVAGNNCYNRAEIDDVFFKIKRIFLSHNIKVVGGPYESLYEDRHMLDTYYHIDSAGARDRTEKLINNIYASGIHDLSNKNNSSINNFFDDSILQYGLRDLSKHLLQLKSGHFSTSNGDFYNYFYLIPSQWHIADDRKLYPIGENYSLLFKSDQACSFKFNFYNNDLSEVTDLLMQRSLYQENQLENLTENTFKKLERITFSTTPSSKIENQSEIADNTVSAQFLGSVDVSCTNH